jgi:hypothetical protein
LRDAACDWIASTTGPERIARAVAFVLDMAHLLGDEVRRRAQRGLEGLPEIEQRRVLEDTAGPSSPPTDSVSRLVSLLIAGQA